MPAEKRSLLFVFAHPDDESYTVAGTIARYARDGKTRVAVATLTRGESSRHLASLGIPAEELGRRREAEVREALAHLGPVEHFQFAFPDGGMRQLDPREVEATIADVVRRVRPDVLVTFDVHGISGHPDHNVTTACVTRVFLEERERTGCPRRLVYVVVRPEDVEGLARLLHAARPGEIDVEIDCEEFLEARRRALHAHRSVIGDIERDNRDERLMRATECYLLYRERPEGRPVRDLFAGLDGAPATRC